MVLVHSSVRSEDEAVCRSDSGIEVGSGAEMLNGDPPPTTIVEAAVASPATEATMENNNSIEWWFERVGPQHP